MSVESKRAVFLTTLGIFLTVLILVIAFQVWPLVPHPSDDHEHIHDECPAHGEPGHDHGIHHDC